MTRMAFLSFALVATLTPGCRGDQPKGVPKVTISESTAGKLRLADSRGQAAVPDLRGLHGCQYISCMARLVLFRCGRPQMSIVDETVRQRLVEWRIQTDDHAPGRRSWIFLRVRRSSC